MNRLFFYLLIVLSMTVNSCINYIDHELDIKPKLVLHCYLVPQLDTTILCLTNSSPIFTSKPREIAPVVNALVEISDDNNRWFKMEFDFENNIYYILQTQFPILEGKTYYVRASAPGYETVSSSCTVPYFRETNLELVYEDCTLEEHAFVGSHDHGYIKWNDYPGEENYYLFYRQDFNWYSNGWVWHNNEYIPLDTNYYYAWYLLSDINDKPCIFSDIGRDGKKMSVIMMDYIPEKFEMTLLQADKNCYLHELSFWDWERHGDLQFFMLEPIQLYTNIKNGYGVFGAFTMQDYTFELTSRPPHYPQSCRRID
jgi:hypothetical protein